MAVEKSIGQVMDDQVRGGVVVSLPGQDSDDDGIVVEIESEEDLVDGQLPEEGDEEEIPFNANLAEYIHEDELATLAKEVIENVEIDIGSRSEWMKAYVAGLDLLGTNTEDRTDPWEGACGIFHPVLAEAAVRFQSEAIMELHPASGPALTKIVGKSTPEKIRQSQRVAGELNYLATEKIEDYRDETEALLFFLPLAGSSFRKVYFDETCGYPAAQYVQAEDLIVPYMSSNLRTAPRCTHRFRITKEEMGDMMDSGFYRSIELAEPVVEETDTEKKYAKMEGMTRAFGDDDRHTILECHMRYNFDGEFDEGHAPYVVSVEKTSGEVLAVRRNWKEGDTKKKKRNHFVHYKYFPGTGFYGFGLIHLIGGLAKGATSVLRQLVDAGTLSNLPAGFKTRGLRVKNDEEPLSPGEFRDADVPSGSIRDNLYVIPFNEPSGTLYQLMNNLVDEARRLGSTAEADIGSMNSEAPVGTTLAILERSLIVSSAVKSRLHASMKQELRLIASVVHDFMPEEYEYEVDEDANRKEDFDGRVDVIPVSDPNASTLAQRVVKHQAAITAAAQAPQIYNQAVLHRRLVETLGIEGADEIVKLPEEIRPSDPVAENMAILKQEPVKAFEYQDHESHIAAHMAAAEDPKIQQIVGQSPFAAAIQSAMSAHITEHVAYAYRQEMEKKLGVALPPSDKPIPEDVERSMSSAIAAAADKLLRQNKAEAQQEQAAAQEADPLTQIQKRKIDLEERKLKHREIHDMRKLKIDEAVAASQALLSRERIKSEERREGARLGVRVATDADRASRAAVESGVKIGLEIAREMAKSGMSVDDVDE